MPRIGVSYDAVAHSIAELERAGLNPTIRLIRKSIGTGSLTTIAEHKRCYDTQKPRDSTSSFAHAELASRCDAYRAELITTKEKSDYAQSRLKHAEQQITSLTASLKEARSNVESNRTIADEYIERSHQLEAEAVEAETLIVDLKTTTNGYQNEVERLTKQLIVAKAGKMDAQKAAVVLEKKAYASRVYGKRLNAEASGLRDELSSLSEKLGETRGLLSAARIQIKNDTEEFDKKLKQKEQIISNLNAALDDAQEFVRTYKNKY